MVAAVAAGFALYMPFATRAPALRAQRALSRTLTRVVTRSVRVVAAPSVPRVEWPRAIALGTPIGTITIPAANVRGDVVVEGVDRQRLALGPGHYPGTALPGEPGNLVVSGHRTTWLRPFYDLQAVHPGDHVIVEVRHLTWIYTVTSVRSVLPTDVSVLDRRRGWTVTLTTCTPRYSAARRLVVFARLDRAATLASVARRTRARRYVYEERVTSLPAAFDPIRRPPLATLAGWVAGTALSVAVALTRRRLGRVLPLLAAGWCCFEAYGAAALWLPQVR